MIYTGVGSRRVPAEVAGLLRQLPDNERMCRSCLRMLTARLRRAGFHVIAHYDEIF